MTRGALRAVSEVSTQIWAFSNNLAFQDSMKPRLFDEPHSAQNTRGLFSFLRLEGALPLSSEADRLRPVGLFLTGNVHEFSVNQKKRICVNFEDQTVNLECF